MSRSLFPYTTDVLHARLEKKRKPFRILCAAIRTTYLYAHCNITRVQTRKHICVQIYLFMCVCIDIRAYLYSGSLRPCEGWERDDLRRYARGATLTRQITRARWKCQWSRKQIKMYYTRVRSLRNVRTVRSTTITDASGYGERVMVWKNPFFPFANARLWRRNTKTPAETPPPLRRRLFESGTFRVSRKKTGAEMFARCLAATSIFLGVGKTIVRIGSNGILANRKRVQNEI